MFLSSQSQFVSKKGSNSVTMRLDLIVLSILCCLCILLNKVSTSIIVKYYQKKAPGHQSLVDLFFIDFLKLYSLTCATFVGTLCIGCLNQGSLTFQSIQMVQLPIDVAYFTAFVVEALNLFTLTKLITFLTVKYLHIYHFTVVSEVEDERKLNKILTRIQLFMAILCVFDEYFGAGKAKDEFMTYNVYTIGNGGTGKPASIYIPFIVLAIGLALFLQIRIEIDNYHYQDSPGFFLNILLSFQRDAPYEEAKSKCGYFYIVVVTLLFIAFFALLPLVEMSNFRLFVVLIIFYGLYVCPPILFIFMHEKLKDYLMNFYLSNLLLLFQLFLPSFQSIEERSRNSRMHSQVV